MAREFSEFSNEYSIKKANFTDIADHLDEIMKIREDIEFAEQQLNALKAKKSNLSLFSAFMTEDEKNSEQADIDVQIAAIKENIRTLKSNTLYKTKEEIEATSTTLDSYINDLNTNFEFKAALREEIKRQSKESMLSLEQAKTSPSMALALFNKLETLSEQDPLLKSYLTIDKDKINLSLMEDLISQYSNITPGNRGSEAPAAKKERETKLKVFKDEAESFRRKIQSKGSSLQQYILKHKSELGIPDDMTIDFNDRTSPFYAIATYTNPNSNTSFKDIEKIAISSIQSIDGKIKTLQDYVRHADKDLHQIELDKEEELEDLKLYKKFGFVSKIKRTFAGIGKGLSNWLKDKPHPFKGVFKRPDSSVTPTAAKVVDTDKSFVDAYKTEIGQDAYKKVIEEYNKRIEEERTNPHGNNEHGRD